MSTKKLANKTIISLLVLLAFTLASIVGIIVSITSARYVKTEKDEIIAHYTSLYLDSTGANRVVTLENNVGYVNFNLMNYIDENVTQRDIIYTISKPEAFYNETGELLDPSQYSTSKLHVLDVWRKPVEIGEDSYKYNVSIVGNSGEKIEGEQDKYKFTYEKVNGISIGKTHRIQLKFERTDSSQLGLEKVSVVVQLEKPYKEVHVFNITISNRLIAFSTSDTKKYDVDFATLYVQSVASYAYVEGGSDIRAYDINDVQHKVLNNPLKLTITWEGLLLDENIKHRIHTGIEGSTLSQEQLDKINSGEIYISDPFLYSIKSTIGEGLDGTIGKGEMIIFVPQSSNFYIDFQKYSSIKKIYVKVEVFTEYGSPSTKQYELYSSNEFAGFEYDENSKYCVYSEGE